MQKRLFIAIDIPEYVKKYIYKITSNLFKGDKDIKIVSYSNIHITLKFLGNTNLSKIEKIKQAVKKTADSFKNFSYEIKENLGAFPTPENARVVFVEVGNGAGNISNVYNKLEDNLSKIKIRKEKRKFIPHLTVARIKGRKNVGDIIKKAKINHPISQMNCSKITLFESKLKPEGAEYIIIDEFGLE